MEQTLDERVERLLDQLEAPGLTVVEIAKIKDKIDYLKSLKQDQE